MRLQKNHFPVCSSSPEIGTQTEHSAPSGTHTAPATDPARGPRPGATCARRRAASLGLLPSIPSALPLCLKCAFFPLSRNTSQLLESVIKRVEGWNIPAGTPWEGCPHPIAFSHEQILEPSAAAGGSERAAASPKLAQPQFHSNRTNFWTKGCTAAGPIRPAANRGAQPLHLGGAFPDLPGNPAKCKC